jgi:undecaprenyl-diphosphatase
MLGERGQDQGRRPSKQALLLGVVVCVAVGLVLLNRYAVRGGSAASPTGRQFQLLDALVLGVVEGVTEYLPVSSTGHLLLSQHILGLTSTEQAKIAADAYAVIIQIGAILAVLSLYRRRAEQMAWGFLGRDPIGLRLGVMLVIAFLPAAVVGLAFERVIKQHLFGPWPIVVGWLVGGIVILALPRRLGSESNSKLHSVEDVDWRPALMIGVFQVCAMWPGVSRSLATIVGGLVAGLGLTAAVEFSFLLGLITLGAATTFELLQDGTRVMSEYGIALPLVGILSSFFAAWVSVKWLVAYLQRHGLAIFGYYRILLALVVAWLLVQGIL